MTTIDGTPTLTGVLAYWFTKRLQRTARERAEIASNRMHVGAWLTLVRLVLHVGAFCALTYAAFLWDKIAGFTVAGILLLVLSALLTGRSAPTDNHR